MRRFVSPILAAALLAALLATPVFAEATQTAQYRVTFQATWSASSHPSQFPGDRAHFSPLIGGVHNSEVSFWDAGQIASDGIENMAEIGAVSPLDSEAPPKISPNDFAQ